jgi:hypothetical protein
MPVMMPGAPPNPVMTQQILQTLKDSLMPSHREWAAEALASFDWRIHSQVIEALVVAAKDDPAGSVRAACARSLGKMRADSAQVAALLQTLRADPDPRVRQEAVQVLVSLGMAPKSEPAAVQPAGGNVQESK